jgi:hypothetical protein
MIDWNNIHFSVFPPDAKPYGIAYGNWTIKWWRWALSAPISANPVLDDTGQFADTDQEGPVWFLAGTVGDLNKIANRKCIIPKGKAVLFPVINYICTHNSSESELVSASDLVRLTARDIDDITVRDVMVDGELITAYRISSEPKLFRLTISSENILKIPSGLNEAAADGYWVFLGPMECGRHSIGFHGACAGGARNAAANYDITIV